MRISVEKIKTISEKLPPNLARIVRRLTKPWWRRKIAMQYYSRKLSMISEWSKKDTETSNFYYKLTPTNRDHLAQLIAALTDHEWISVTRYFDELENDAELRSHIEDALINSGYGSDIKVEYGRRLGWYAFARALKPTVIVETGVDHGVGSCVLASALLRNAREGYAGTYYGTEIRPEAGKLFCGKYSSVGKILYRDSIESLRQLSDKIDIFINDSDHSSEYEYQEYATIADKLSEGGIILGDNSHSTDSLSRFSREQGRKFVFFAEQPADHWYPGAGIGISYKRKGAPQILTMK